MVVRANRESDGIGGHISTYASAATLYEVAFNHFFRGKAAGADADLIYFQGHASPGVYARAFLEGRLTETHLRNFRHELRKEGGLSSYPHPWLMPDFWEFPTVSMGLGPLQAIYQARYAKYLENRGLKPVSDQKVWAFLGDGETDEPEALGSISLAAREKLDNLIFVINCNLQRLDGPVRGNGQIVQELEAVFRGAGWNVIKVLWGSAWDELLARDNDGLLVKRMGEVVDGEYQRYVVEDGAYLRENFWGADPRLLEMVSHLSDSQLKHLPVGGHDPQKVYNAYRAAVTTKGMPTVILARTIKGYGLGEAGEGKNITHQQKKMNETDLRSFRDRFGVPIPDDRIADAPFYRPDEKSREIAYIKERREALGGVVPKRVVAAPAISPDMPDVFEEFFTGTEGRKASTTMVFVKMLAKLLRDKEIGKLVVPIVPDEARTFGMESLFRAVGIYSASASCTSRSIWTPCCITRKRRTGRFSKRALQRRDRSRRSSPRARVRHARRQHDSVLHFYSMFGFQRVGDFIWSAADSRCRGFLLGGTSGRTTLAVRDCSIRTATATRSRCRCRRAAPTILRTRSSWRRSSATASSGCTAIRSRRSTTSPS
jgi:pyruvate dehydrogenase E1 component